MFLQKAFINTDFLFWGYSNARLPSIIVNYCCVCNVVLKINCNSELLKWDTSELNAN